MQFLMMLTIFSAVSLGGSYGSLMLLEQFGMEDNTYAIYGCFGVCLLLGLCLGWCMRNFIKTSMTILGGVGGGCLAVIITQACMMTNENIRMGLVFGLSLLGAILGFRLSKAVVIFVSSFLGAFMTVRGVSLFAGGYPNELTLAKLIQMGHITWETFPKIFYAYLLCMVLLTIIGIWYQAKTSNKDKKGSSNSSSKKSQDAT